MWCSHAFSFFGHRSFAFRRGRGGGIECRAEVVGEVIGICWGSLFIGRVLLLIAMFLVPAGNFDVLILVRLPLSSCVSRIAR